MAKYIDQIVVLLHALLEIWSHYVDNWWRDPGGLDGWPLVTCGRGYSMNTEQTKKIWSVSRQCTWVKQWSSPSPAQSSSSWSRSLPGNLLCVAESDSYEAAASDVGDTDNYNGIKYICN